MSAIHSNFDIIKGLGHMIELHKAEDNIQRDNYKLQSKLNDLQISKDHQIAEEFGLVKNKDRSVIVQY